MAEPDTSELTPAKKNDYYKIAMLSFTHSVLDKGCFPPFFYSLSCSVFGIISG